VGLWVCILQFCSYMASALRQQGELEAAAAELERSMVIAERRGYLDFVPLVFIEAARLLAHPQWNGAPILGARSPREAIERAYRFVDEYNAPGFRRLIAEAEAEAT
jgi:hypothetical protein